MPTDRTYVDHGLTGTTRARPGLREALAACRSGDTLVVTKLDRLARSVPDARDIVAELIASGVCLQLGASVHDPTDPVGRLLFNVLAMVAEFEARAPALCAEIGVDFASQTVGQFDPPAFDETLVQRVRDCAERLGYSHMDIVSGAGHDACWINKVAPTVMIMCPCVDGLSHNEAEEITPEWAAAGADVLLNAVLETAGVAG